MQHWHHPVLSCKASKVFEDNLFGNDSKAAALAMEQAGVALADAIADEFRIRMNGSSVRCLLLAGKGNNTGDGLIAMWRLLELFPDLRVDILQIVEYDLSLGSEGNDLFEWWRKVLGHERVWLLPSIPVDAYDFSVDGIFGMQFRAPLSGELKRKFEAIRALDIGIRIAVDLPSAMSDEDAEDALRADFTYATGILKSPVVDPVNLSIVGRVRYLDIGFFEKEYPFNEARKVLSKRLLSEAKSLRPVASDKRTFGHLLIVAGSRNMPGALIMCVEAAVRSGVGLITVMAPESVASQCAVRIPEAMWIPCPETVAGGLAADGIRSLEKLVGRITGVVMGPGCGQEPETQALLDEVVEMFESPIVLDADALTEERIMRIQSLSQPFVLTPHVGEFMRISGYSNVENSAEQALLDFTNGLKNAVVVLKGPLSKISDGNSITYVPFGNPILARGGSGDILAGLLGGKVAMNSKQSVFSSVASAVSIHASAADRLFAQKEETHIRTCDILNHLNLF